MGALFCDGQYVDVGGDIESCLTDLKNLLNIQVSGSASCSGDECTAMGQASASCAASPDGGAPLSGGFAIVGLGALGAAVARRRARKHTA
jgi:MYXO-CTERM domain-containing protein